MMSRRPKYQHVEGIRSLPADQHSPILDVLESVSASKQGQQRRQVTLEPGHYMVTEAVQHVVRATACTNEHVLPVVAELQRGIYRYPPLPIRLRRNDGICNVDFGKGIL